MKGLALIASLLSTGLLRGGMSAEQLSKQTLRGPTLQGPRFRAISGRTGQRRNKKTLEAARARTAALKGEPPGYTMAHHDKLVRLCGAKRTRELERAFLPRRGQVATMKYIEALAIAQQRA